MALGEWLKRIGRRGRRPGGMKLRPICPICEKPMERRGSTVWMCPDFPRCPGTIAAD